MGRINYFVYRTIAFLLFMLCFSGGALADSNVDYIQMSATSFTAYPGQQNVSLPSAYMYVNGALSDNYNLYYKIEGGKEYTDAASGMVYSMHESTGTVINELTHKITVGSNVTEKNTLVVNVIAKPKYKSTVEKGVTTSFELIISPLETSVFFRPSDELTLDLEGSCNLPTPQIKYGFNDITNKYTVSWGTPSDINLVSVKNGKIIAAKKEGTCTIPYTVTSREVAYTTLSGNITVHVKSGAKLVYVTFPNNGVQTEYQGLLFQFNNMAAVQSTVPIYTPTVYDQNGNDITNKYSFTFDYNDPIQEKEVQLANTYYSQGDGLTRKTTWTKKTVCYNKSIGNGGGQLVLGTLDEKYNEREFPIYFTGKSTDSNYPECNATLTLRLIPRVPEFSFVPNPEQTVFRTGYLMSQINRFTPSGEWVNEKNGNKALITWNSPSNGKIDETTDKFKFGYLFAVEKAKIDQGYIRVEEGNSKFKATRNGYNIYFSTLGWNTAAETWNIYISKACRFNIKYIVNYNAGVEGQFKGGNDIDDPTYWKDLVVTAKERIVPTMNIDPDYIVTSPNKTVSAPEVSLVANDSYLDQVVYSPAGKNILDFYDLTYKIEKDGDPSSMVASIDTITGDLKVKDLASIPTNNTITVTIKATPKIKDDQTLGTLYDAEGNILSNPYQDISGTYTIKVIKDYSNYYEINTDTKTAGNDKMGKLHFINSKGTTEDGEVVAGVGFTGIAGLDVTFGNKNAEAATKWLIKNVKQYKGTVDNANDEKNNIYYYLVVPEISNTFAVGNKNVPANAIKLKPYTNGFVTLDFYDQLSIDLSLIDSDGNELASYRGSGNDNKSEEHIFNHALIAGKTYYIYQKSNSNKAIYVHGINFAPCYISSDNLSDSTTVASGFANNFAGSLPTLIGDESKYVTFGSSNTSVATVDVNSGVVASVGTGDADIYGFVKSAVNGVIRRPSYKIVVSDIPYYKVANTEATTYKEDPSVGYKVSTQNYQTDITMTFGGFANAYQLTKNNSTKSYNDKWKSPEEDGVITGVIDGFKKFSKGTNDVFDEVKKSYSQYDFKEDNTGNHNTFTLPTYGTYVKFEPRESGTLIVYLLQNGLCDYQSRNPENYIDTQAKDTLYQMKWRPLYIVDQSGRPVDINNNYTGFSGKTEHPGYYADGHVLSLYNDSNVKSYVEDNVDSPKIIGDCSFDWTKFFRWYTESATTPNEKTALVMGAEDKAEELIKYWKDKGLNDSEDIIRINSSSFMTLHKSYVRYTFDVKAGNTYFVFQYGSKIALNGFSFVPKDWNTNKDVDSRQNARPTVTLTDGQDYNGEHTEDNVFVELRKRNFSANSWASICLPFNVSQAEFKNVFGDGAQIIHLTSITDKNGDKYSNTKVANFTQHYHHMIEAGRPYFIKPTKPVTSPVFSHVTFSNADPSLFIKKTDMCYSFKGTYKKEDMPAYSYYMGSNGMLKRTLANNNINGFRSYLRYEGTEANAKKFSLYIGEDDEITGISSAEIDGVEEDMNCYDNKIYNLQGICLGSDAANLNSGIYIRNGKKFIVK